MKKKSTKQSRDEIKWDFKLVSSSYMHVAHTSVCTRVYVSVWGLSINHMVLIRIVIHLCPKIDYKIFYKRLNEVYRLAFGWLLTRKQKKKKISQNLKDIKNSSEHLQVNCFEIIIGYI